MSYTVLVVDDNATIRQFCQVELESVGYRVLLARDGDQAIDVLARQLPDLVVLDVHMPGRDGRQVVRQIKSAYPWIPVIFHSSDWTALGADASVLKTEDLAPLKAAICQFLPSSNCSTNAVAD